MSSVLIIKTKQIGINSPAGNDILETIDKITKEYNLERLNDKKDKKILIYFSESKVDLDYLISRIKAHKAFNSTIQRFDYHNILKTR